MYRQLEDAFYSLLDWLDAHGIPAYKVHDWLEDHGIPPFPFFLGLILLIVGGAAFFFLHAQTTYNDVMIYVTDSLTGEPVAGARVTLYVDGQAFETQVSDETGTVIFSSIPDGYYTVDIDAPGYKKLVMVPIEDGKEIQLEKTSVLPYTLCIQVQDALSGETIRGADVLAHFSGITKRATFDEEEGCYTVTVPNDTRGTISVSVEGYKPKTVSFHADQEKTIVPVLLERAEEGAPGHTITIFVKYRDNPARARVYIKDVSGNVVSTAEVFGEGRLDNIPPGTYTLQVNGLEEASGLTYVSKPFYLEGDRIFSIDLSKGTMEEEVSAEEDANQAKTLEDLLEQLKVAKEENDEETVKSLEENVPSYPQKDENLEVEDEASVVTEDNAEVSAEDVIEDNTVADLPSAASEEEKIPLRELLKNLKYKVMVNGTDMLHVAFIPAKMEDEISVCASSTGEKYADTAVLTVSYGNEERNVVLSIVPKDCSSLTITPPKGVRVTILLQFFKGDRIVYKRKWVRTAKAILYSTEICVKDPYESPIQGAKIDISGEGREVSVYTTSDGCVKTRLEAGSYSLKVTKDLFKPWEGTLEVFQDSRKDIVLMYENIEADVALQGIYRQGHPLATLPSGEKVQFSFSVTVPPRARTAKVVVEIEHGGKFEQDASSLIGKSGEVDVDVHVPFAGRERQETVHYWLEITTPEGTETRAETSKELWITPIVVPCGGDGYGINVKYPDVIGLGDEGTVTVYVGACRSVYIDYVFDFQDTYDSQSFELKPFELKAFSYDFTGSSLGNLVGSVTINGEKLSEFSIQVVPHEDKICGTLSWSPDRPVVGKKLKITANVYLCEDPNKPVEGARVQITGGLAFSGEGGSCTTNSNGTCEIDYTPTSSGDLLLTCDKDGILCNLVPNTINIYYENILRPEEPLETFVIPLVDGLTSNTETYVFYNNTIFDVRITDATIECENEDLEGSVTPPSSIGGMEAGQVTVSLWYKGKMNTKNSLGMCTVRLFGTFQDKQGNLYYAMGEMNLNVTATQGTPSLSLEKVRDVYAFPSSTIPGIVTVKVSTSYPIYDVRVELWTDDPDVSVSPSSISLGTISSDVEKNVTVNVSGGKESKEVTIFAKLSYRLTKSNLISPSSTDSSTSITINYADAPLIPDPADVNVVLLPDGKTVIINNKKQTSSTIGINKKGSIVYTLESAVKKGKYVTVIGSLTGSNIELTVEPTGEGLTTPKDEEYLPINIRTYYPNADGRFVSLSPSPTINVHVIAFAPNCLQVKFSKELSYGGDNALEIHNNCGVPLTCDIYLARPSDDVEDGDKLIAILEDNLANNPNTDYDCSCGTDGSCSCTTCESTNTNCNIIVKKSDKPVSIPVDDVYFYNFKTDKEGPYAYRVDCKYDNFYTFASRVGGSYILAGQLSEETFTVPTCDGSGGAEPVVLPRVEDIPLTTGEEIDCSHAFCGYEEIKQELNGFVWDLLQKIYDKASEIEQGAERAPEGCSGSWCPLVEFQASKYIYAKDVSITDWSDVFQYKIGEGDAAITYIPAYGEVSDPQHKILIDGRFEGCGQYSVVTTVYFKVQDGYLLPDHYIKLTIKRLESCQERFEDKVNDPLLAPLHLDFGDFSQGYLRGKDVALICVDGQSFIGHGSTDYIVQAIKSDESLSKIIPENYEIVRNNCDELEKGIVIRYEAGCEDHLFKLSYKNNKLTVGLCAVDLSTTENQERFVNLLKGVLTMQPNFQGCRTSDGSYYINEVGAPGQPGTGTKDLGALVPGVWYEFELNDDDLSKLCGGYSVCKISLDFSNLVENDVFVILKTDEGFFAPVVYAPEGLSCPRGFESKQSGITGRNGNTPYKYCAPNGATLTENPHQQDSFIGTPELLVGNGKTYRLYVYVDPTKGWEAKTYTFKVNGIRIAPAFGTVEMTINFSVKRAELDEFVKNIVAPEGYPNIPSPEEHVKAALEAIKKNAVSCKYKDNPWSGYWAQKRECVTCETCVYVPEWDMDEAKQIAGEYAGDGPYNYKLTFLGTSYNSAAEKRSWEKTLSDPYVYFGSIAAGTVTCSAITGICAGATLEVKSLLTLLGGCFGGIILSQALVPLEVHLDTTELLGYHIPSLAIGTGKPYGYHISTPIIGLGTGTAYALRQYLLLRHIGKIIPKYVTHVTNQEGKSVISLLDEFYRFRERVLHMRGHWRLSPYKEQFQKVYNELSKIKQGMKSDEYKSILNNIKQTQSELKDALKEIGKGAVCGALGLAGGELARIGFITLSHSGTQLPSLNITYASQLLNVATKKIRIVGGLT